MINNSSTSTTTNSMMSSSSANNNKPQSPAGTLKTYFKTPEGRYKLQNEKTHPAGLLHYAHGKTLTQVTLAHLKDKPTLAAPPASSSLGVSSGVRSAAARFLSTGNGSRALSFVGGNGSSKSVSGANRIGSLGALSSNNLPSNSNFDGKGTYLIFNVGDAVFISDLNSQDKDPVKSIHFSNSNPICHAFDADAKDGHDFLIGLASGDDGNLYVYEKSKDGSSDPSFPVIKDQTQFSVAHARYSKDLGQKLHGSTFRVARFAFSACYLHSSHFRANLSIAKDLISKDSKNESCRSTSPLSGTS